MSHQADVVDALEVQIVRSWVLSQSDDIQMAAAQVVARMRVLEAASLLFSLIYSHSESTNKSIFSDLSCPGVTAAFQVLQYDSEQFIGGAKFEARILGTTRPDGFWRACGVGRPKRKKP